MSEACCTSWDTGCELANPSSNITSCRTSVRNLCFSCNTAYAVVSQTNTYLQQYRDDAVTRGSWLLLELTKIRPSAFNVSHHDLLQSWIGVWSRLRFEILCCNETWLKLKSIKLIKMHPYVQTGILIMTTHTHLRGWGERQNGKVFNHKNRCYKSWSSLHMQVQKLFTKIGKYNYYCFI